MAVGIREVSQPPARCSRCPAGHGHELGVVWLLPGRADVEALLSLETQCLAEAPCVTASDRHGLVGACVGGEK